MSAQIPRRDFFGMVAAAGLGSLLASTVDAWGLDQVSNPLATYPDRGWERVYRDLWKYDSTFTFTCAPNDTHNCILNAYVRNGVVVRIGPTMRYGEAADLAGNTTTHRWDPRVCQKGLALTRRFYGDRRVSGCMVRAGFRQWYEAGFPRGADGLPPPTYFRRGRDEWVRVTHDEGAAIAAAALKNIAETYSGAAGAARLRAQHYDEATIEAVRGAGVQTMKFRGGMPLLGMTRVFGMYRLANSMALLDAHVRKVGADQALGAKGFDNYSWHTDLPPGHPMVTGQQTVEFDLSAVEHCKTLVVWGMNWVTTKMPDAHWLTEARLKGTKVVVIACEYSATACKGDEVIIVRPGTTPALALGLSHVILRDELYDREYVTQWTDLPVLVRLDTLKNLRAQDVFGGPPAALTQTKVLGAGEVEAPPIAQRDTIVSEKMRGEWGDYVWWDRRSQAPKPLTRDQVGRRSPVRDPLLEGAVEVALKDGRTVTCRPVFDLLKTYAAHFDPATTESITWAPAASVESLARHVAKEPGTTLFALGMGPNQFFNSDNKDRATILLASLTGNVGRIGGNIGSYAGNYRTALFNGCAQYINENPFDIELDPEKPARPKQYWRAESAHYYNHEDHPLRVGKKLLTGSTHIPAPTKSLWFANANSILGNVKWHYNTVLNVLPRIEMIAVHEWWWTASCEWADIVFGVDSWSELKHPDMTASVTNPFLAVFPRTPLKRIFDTMGDIEVQALVGSKLAGLTGDRRFLDYWQFVREGRVDAYLQRILDFSTNTRGLRFADLHEKASRGIPALLNSRTSPKAVGFDQVADSKPWYTKTGRLEFYREEDEFIEAGENLPVHREPVDSTFYEPNVIVAPPHEAIRPASPESYGLSRRDLSCEARCGRNVVMTWSEASRTKHPLRQDPAYRFIFHTPKYRHGSHTMPIDIDMIAVLFGPFGDLYRHDRRSPFVTEGYVDINPSDARELGVDDGDYVWIDADPEDRPFRGWQRSPRDMEFARLLCRARYYPGTPRGVTRMWFNMYTATPGSIEGQKTRPDGLAKNPRTGYQAMFRSGSHQSATRGWLKPTWMTDSLVHKTMFGQGMRQGFEPDIHCPTGAPRESFVKITRAESGGIDRKGLWRPAAMGIRPRYESDAMQKYLAGGFVAKEKP
ncbi:MAG TPA: molybdopterin-dependent oxidoreductase [Vicinamibacterales bacterium]|nr:molybdopterin-dependent oxidoreductase [Vicinamibacterales bacterium]HPW19336.1 molybdopterin-dependent oxidoreductase [Vicinamibacterales bacterium]